VINIMLMYYGGLPGHCYVVVKVFESSLVCCYVFTMVLWVVGRQMLCNFLCV